MLLTYIFVSDILQAISEEERFGAVTDGKVRRLFRNKNFQGGGLSHVRDL